MKNEQVVLLEVESNYTFIHFENGERQILPYNLSFVGKELNDNINFIRPNRKVMINEKFIIKIDKYKINALGKDFHISRRRKYVKYWFQILTPN